MQTEVVIRTVRDEDAPELLKFYNYYIENTAIHFDYDPWTLEQFTDRMHQIKEGYPYLVAEQDGKLLGFAYAGVFKAREAYKHSVETTIYMNPEQKRKGVGRKLYEALEAECRKRGIRNMYACIGDPEVEDEYLTHNSVEFHTHMGYHLVGRFHKCGRKFNRFYDMVWMEKLLVEE